jgi:hypothetical protein
METSPGNKQPVYVLAKGHAHGRGLSLCQGTAALHQALIAVRETSRTCGAFPGTLNWPNKEKVHERNRPRTPQPVRVLEPWQGEVIDAAALRAKLGERFHEDERPEDDPGHQHRLGDLRGPRSASCSAGQGLGALEIIGWFDVACIDKDNGDRSNHSCRVIMKLFELGFSEGDVLALMLGTECAKRYTS